MASAVAICAFVVAAVVAWRLPRVAHGFPFAVAFVVAGIATADAIVVACGIALALVSLVALAVVVKRAHHQP